MEYAKKPKWTLRVMCPWAAAFTANRVMRRGGIFQRQGQGLYKLNEYLALVDPYDG